MIAPLATALTDVSALLMTTLVGMDLSRTSNEQPRPIYMPRGLVAYRLDELTKDQVWEESGEPRGDGPLCMTCGALAAFDSHPSCDRDHGSLIVYRVRSRSPASG
jgi:hypothetical protein